MKLDADALKAIRDIHRDHKEAIVKRLKEFDDVWKLGDESELFLELVFCLLTPQSKARICWETVQELVDAGLLETCDIDAIAERLRRVRFKNNKARYVVEAAKKFGPRGESSLKDTINGFDGTKEVRDWLVENVRGLGYKEASHFLRNIGLGKDLAILDRHVLKNILEIGIIDEIPTSLTRKRYIQIEDLMDGFACKIGIPLSHLDLVLWFRETGDMFK